MKTNQERIIGVYRILSLSADCLSFFFPFSHLVVFLSSSFVYLMMSVPLTFAGEFNKKKQLMMDNTVLLYEENRMSCPNESNQSMLLWSATFIVIFRTKIFILMRDFAHALLTAHLEQANEPVIHSFFRAQKLNVLSSCIFIHISRTRP
jgi:hypothetical protein